jgi:hypothetical protein
MGETEVCSPISRRGSAVGSGQPLSPGAQSNPSRGDGRRDAAPGASQIKTHAEPEPPRPTRAGEPEPAQTTIVGPED